MRIENGIAMSNDVVSKEKLPLPFVYYPGMYSVYFAFSKNNKSQLYLCSCAYESIENEIKLNLKFKIGLYTKYSPFYALRISDFPNKLFLNINYKKLPNTSDVIKHFHFKNKLCHECNRKVPVYKYCHEMYGGTFKQKYGWYINKQYYEYGMFPSTELYIPEICPQEILDLIKIIPSDYRNLNTLRSQGKQKEFKSLLEKLTFQSFGENPYPENQYSFLISEFGKQKSRINKIVENVVREKFGFKKIGEAWTSETILYYIIKSLYSKKIVHRHYRPKFLEGLEFDIFIEELNLAVEYQGIQHFKPINHWGGVDSFKKLKKRDTKKRKICKSMGINLIYFNYDEELNESFVRARIDSKIKS